MDSNQDENSESSESIDQDKNRTKIMLKQFTLNEQILEPPKYFAVPKYPEFESKVRIIYVERRFKLSQNLENILDSLFPNHKKKIQDSKFL